MQNRMKSASIKELIQANPRSTFEYYRKKELFYKCGDLLFRIPIADTGDGSFASDMKSITLMRWIRLEIADEIYNGIGEHP